MRFNYLIVNFQFSILSSLLCGIFLFASYASIVEQNDTESSKVKIEKHFVFDTIQPTLDEIVKSSGKIFAGECKEVKFVEKDLESKLPVYEITFKITEGVKGVHGEKEVTFKQWQPTIRQASYEMGKKYILFLYPESERGLTSPVAIQYGKFDILREGIIRKRDVVRNGHNNRGLTRNLKTRKKITIEEDKFVDKYLDTCSVHGAPIRYKEFIKAVKFLVNKEK
ncbi:MAG: hypothetical protein HYY52_02745 [Candidatus Melainabacteria bacterium]|nr:hypothetical protein [Candidatus Melainabacteria bacterium]